MGTLGNAKILGGVGAILMLVGGLATGVISLVGLILVFIAIKYISDIYNDKKIFNNFLYFLILEVVATIVFAGIIFYAIGGVGFYSTFSSSSGGINSSDFSKSFSGFLTICILGFVVYYILGIIAALYLRKSFDAIANYTRVNMFKTAALIYLIGAALVIILVGIFVIIVADILIIVAFFSLPDNPTPMMGAPGTQGMQGYPQQQTTGRICPNCGRSIPMDAQVCPYCGRDFRK